MVTSRLPIPQPKVECECLARWIDGVQCLCVPATIELAPSKDFEAELARISLLTRAIADFDGIIGDLKGPKAVPLTRISFSRTNEVGTRHVAVLTELLIGVIDYQRKMNMLERDKLFAKIRG